MARRRGRGASPSAGTQLHEAFRVLRTNLEVALADLERPVVVITSATPGEGKTSTCAQLAQALAFAGRRVIAVDLDLRHPDLHNWFGVDNRQGVSDVLLERCPLDAAIQYVPLGVARPSQLRGLYVLPTGSPVSDPPELLSSPRVARLMDGLVSQADIVLIDAPPVLPVADTLVIGRLGAGALLVVAARSTPTTALQRAKDALVRNHVRLLGMVVNKLPENEQVDGYGYGYGYGYERGGDGRLEDFEDGALGPGTPGDVGAPVGRRATRR